MTFDTQILIRLTPLPSSKSDWFNNHFIVYILIENVRPITGITITPINCNFKTCYVVKSAFSNLISLKFFMTNS